MKGGVYRMLTVNNVLAEHMEKYRDIIDETCHRKFKEMMVWKDSSICR